LRAIPEELIDPNFSGTSRAALLGATEDKIGKFQKADGGTLFLDEIGDMSLRTQSKVLRVLENSAVERVGSTNLERRRARHCRNEQASRTGNRARHFSPGSFYRLNVIPF